MKKPRLDPIDVWNQANRLTGDGRTFKEVARSLKIRTDTLMALLYQAVTQGRSVIRFPEEPREKERPAPNNRSQLIIYRPGRANRDVKRLTVPEPLLDQWGIQAGDTVHWSLNKKGQLVGALEREDQA